MYNSNYPPPIVQAPERAQPILWIFAIYVMFGAFLNVIYFILNILNRRNVLEYTNLMPVYTVLNVISLIGYIILYIFAVINIRHSIIKVLVILAAFVHIGTSTYWLVERWLD